MFTQLFDSCFFLFLKKKNCIGIFNDLFNVQNANRDLEMHSKRVEELTIELAPCKEQIRQLDIQLRGRVLNMDGMKIELDKFKLSSSQLEKEVADLQSQLMEKSIQLEYRGLRIDEMEKKMEALTQKNGTETNADQVAELSQFIKRIINKSN